MKNRQENKQLWANRKFIDKLNEIKAKRLLRGKPVNNLGQLTKEMMKCPSFKKLEEELLSSKELQSLIKFDKKILR